MAFSLAGITLIDADAPETIAGGAALDGRVVTLSDGTQYLSVTGLTTHDTVLSGHAVDTGGPGSALAAIQTLAGLAGGGLVQFGGAGGGQVLIRDVTYQEQGPEVAYTITLFHPTASTAGGASGGGTATSDTGQQALSGQVSRVATVPGTSARVQQAQQAVLGAAVNASAALGQAP